MTGHSEIEAKANPLNVLWPDAEFECLNADYNVVAIEVQESTGTLVRIRCHGYIGYERTGAWDEVVVESGALSDSGEYLKKCVGAVEAASAASESGSDERNGRHWTQLEVRFIDGSQLRVVASRFEVVRG